MHILTYQKWLYNKIYIKVTYNSNKNYKALKKILVEDMY